MIVGTEWMVDAEGCRVEALRDRALLTALLERVIQRLELHVVGEPRWHVFGGPGGVTGMYLLSESHLCCHTYPEHESATFNLYCCRPRAAFPWADELARALGAKRVSVRAFERGRGGS